jgi:anthranilate phosphoribosyltransferase
MSTITQAISEALRGQDLSASTSEAVMTQIMKGQATPAQIAGYLVALKAKGEAPEEVVGSARAMRRLLRGRRESQKGLIDTCGTGGDGTGTFNISTISAFVVAGAGGRVAKHGNRAVSSRCGSADLLKELGVNIEANARTVRRCVQNVGLGFLFAPFFHRSMKYAAAPRRELEMRTLFNVLGPLTNPFGAGHQLIGVYARDLVDLLARALKLLGTRHTLVCYGEDGLDEVTTTGCTYVTQVKRGRIRRFTLTPQMFGLKCVHVRSLVGGGPKENARIATHILSGQKGAKRDIVLLNAACALYAGDRVRSIKEGLRAAAQSVDSGQAKHVLELLIRASHGGRK